MVQHDELLKRNVHFKYLVDDLGLPETFVFEIAYNHRKVLVGGSEIFIKLESDDNRPLLCLPTGANRSWRYEISAHVRGLRNFVVHTAIQGPARDDAKTPTVTPNEARADRGKGSTIKPRWMRRVCIASLFLKKEFQQDVRQDFEHFIDDLIDNDGSRWIPLVLGWHYLSAVWASFGAVVRQVVSWLRASG